MRGIHCRLVPTFGLLTLALHSVASGQLVQTFDSSPIARGRAGASTAVFWDGNPNYWANPALLAYHDGIRFAGDSFDFGHDDRHSSDHLTLGAWGLGIALDGRPVDALGGTRWEIPIASCRWVDSLCYAGTGPEYTYWEEVDSWGAGISLATFADSVLRRAGTGIPRVHRFADLSLGIRFNEVEVFFAPHWALRPGSPPGDWTAALSTRDKGYLLRLTPYNSVDYRGLVPALDRVLTPYLGGVRVEAGYGQAVQNYRQAETRYSDGERWTATKFIREGWSVRVATGLPPSLRSALRRAGAEWMAASITPLFSLGMAGDRVVSHGQDWRTDEIRDLYRDHSDGWELCFANMLTIRRGKIRDEEWDLYSSRTTGWGLALSIKDYGTLRYDYAKNRAVEEERDWVEDLEFSGFSVFVRPLKILEAL